MSKIIITEVVQESDPSCLKLIVKHSPRQKTRQKKKKNQTPVTLHALSFHIPIISRLLQEYIA